MTTTEAKTHFTDMLQRLRKMEPSPWPFLCAAVMLEYLAKMAIGSGSGQKDYIDFIKKYMKPDYENFQFANGDKNLPELMYYVLRCGIVHSFSLTPQKKCYRTESIVIAHEGDHLSKYSGADGHQHAVRLVFTTFADDIDAALQKVFSEAACNAGLQTNIENYLRAHPPIQALSPPGPRSLALASSVSAASHGGSGSVHFVVSATL